VLSGLSISTLCLCILLAVALDGLLGEPRRAHPLVGFGRLAQKTEAWLNKNRSESRRRGALAVLLLTLVPAVIIDWLLSSPFSHSAETALAVLCLYLALGSRSLVEHALNVSKALQQGELEQARIHTSFLVSRDTANMDTKDMAKATIESTLENGNDAVFAPLFWFILAGAPGVVFYRLSNTLDAMWGYKTERFLHFGWAAARLDDVLNFIPARLTALSYAIAGKFGNALHCWRHQSPQWKSPNAGPVMAAGAGALALQLGGPAYYHGQLQQRPQLGNGNEPQAQDIKAAINLFARALLIWLLPILLLLAAILLFGLYWTTAGGSFA